MKYTKFLFFVPAVFMLACSSEKKSDEAETTEEEEKAVVEEVVNPLPDTVYQSVEKMKYSVEIVDSETSGKLTSLKDLYAGTKSIMTFRVGSKRQGNFEGRVDTVPTDFVVDWMIETDADRDDHRLGPWGGGTGWTGQPLYVEWPDSVAKKLKSMNLVNAEFTGSEVMIGSLCGKVYFLNHQTGKQTREPIYVGNVIKGTPSFDPTYNGNLYVGHGTPAHQPFGAVVVNLFENKVSHVFGEDPKAQRRWGAYDSSPVRVGQFLFRPSENGGIYKFLIEPGNLKLHSVLRYTVDGLAPGMESSMAVYGNYGFTGDNRGNLIAFNLETMKPVWYYSLGDDIDASPVLMVEDGKPYLYVGCEIDIQQRGYAVFAKIDATNGNEVWKIEPEGRRRQDGKKHFDGGFYSTPAFGTGDCEGLLFTNMVKNTSGCNGVFMAIDRKDGKVVYELPLKFYAWSSPVTYTTPGGRTFVVTADCSGNLYLIDGKKGEIITTKHVGNNFESSPCAIGNSLIIGSRSNGIFKVTLK